MIDLIEDAFAAHGWADSYTRLDGSMSLGDRDSALREFREEKSKEGKVGLLFLNIMFCVTGLKIMLVSLKAGGVGLNLTHANNVFLMDPWYNNRIFLI